MVENKMFKALSFLIVFNNIRLKIVYLPTVSGNKIIIIQ